jgi:hypothetical protein
VCTNARHLFENTARARNGGVRVHSWTGILPRNPLGTPRGWRYWKNRENLRTEARLVRVLAKQVAEENDWPEDWLNDGAQGYLVGISEGPVLFSAPGIEARAPSLEQLLAMKLSAWRDDLTFPTLAVSCKR